MWDVDIKVIKVGTCTLEPYRPPSLMHTGLKYQIGIGGGSTVTIIKTDKDLLMVDTGFERETDSSDTNNETNWNKLRIVLQCNEINPADITKVLVTHFHKDHCGGIENIKKAQWLCHSFAHANLEPSQRDRFTIVNDGDEILPHTVVMHTPGHTRGHISLIWSNKDKTIRAAVCGDAIINLSWLQSGKIWTYNSDFYDQEHAKMSIARLLNEADIIIPGHGQPFFSTEKLKENYNQY